jgi:hypothetical protein
MSLPRTLPGFGLVARARICTVGATGSEGSCKELAAQVLGFNNDGELGDGTLNNSSEAVSVLTE